MQTGETAWNPTGVGKVSLCAGLHGGRWSHSVVEVFQDLCSFSGLPFLRCRRVTFRWAGIVLALVSAVDASEFWVVSVGGTSLADQVAVQTCSVLFNRDESVAGASFVLGLRAVAGRSGGGLHEVHPVSGVAKGYIKYTSWDGNARQTLPQVITLAGVLDAVVLDDSVLSPEGATLLRDIATEWKDSSELSATQHMFENSASQTTGMSKPILGGTRQT